MAEETKQEEKKADVKTNVPDGKKENGKSEKKSVENLTTSPSSEVKVKVVKPKTEEKAKIKSTPGSLLEVLEALDKDHDFLLKGDVFTEDLIETWINYKRKNEYDAVALRPHPYEFFLYYDI